MTSSVLAHLALSFSAHPENIATEALGYILRKSGDAQGALLGFLRQAGVRIEGPLTFRNEVVGTGGERPDLVGIDAEGKEPLVVEAKFWAGLTENQPATYIRRVSGGTVLFVCPAQRIDLLWAELSYRCAKAMLTLTDAHRMLGDTWIARVDGQTHLAITSWRELLAAIGSRLDLADDRTLGADVQQLAGLCEHMDTQAFLPVSSEELTTGIYRRVIEFGNLVDDICNALVADGLADLGGFRAAASIGWTGRWFYLSGAWCLLSCDINKWLTLAATPLWLTIYGPAFRIKRPAEVHRILAALEMASPPRLYLSADGDYTVPLFVPVNVERAAVLGALIEQAKELAHLLKGFGVSVVASEEVATPPDATEIPGKGL